jgi:hypothetical protein
MSIRQHTLLGKGVVENLIQWAIFSVGIAFTPLLFSYFWILLTTEAPHPNFVRAVSSRGELLIVAAALLGEALSDMLKRNRRKNLNLFIGGVCLLVLMPSCFLFASIQTASLNQPLDLALILQWSTASIGFAIFVGAACKFFGKT